ncbi:hypothetical protein Tco_0162888 [Tanacetum coccineum]
MLWSLVKEKFNSIEPTDDKERKIWVELKRLFEPDIDDELWKLQNHIHDLTWKLYDSCGVHHVSTEKGIDIYMLVEKEYPLSRETLTLMLVAKLLVDQDNEMSRELLRKIFMQIQKVNIKFRGGLLGLKGFLVLLKLMLLVMIITAVGYVSTAGKDCWNTLKSDLIKDIEETLLALKKVNMKLNPKKCSFKMEEGKFLGYIVTSKGISVNPEKTKAVMSMPSPNNLKQMQSMSGKLAVEVNLRGLLELGKNDLSLNEYPKQLGSFGS